MQGELILGAGSEKFRFSLNGALAHSTLKRLSDLYWFNSEAKKLEFFDGGEGSMWAKPPAFPDGAAGLVSTAQDYLTFSRMLLNHGESLSGRILTRFSVEAMTSEHLTPEQKRGGTVLSEHQWDYGGYGFGVGVATRIGGPSLTPGQYGWDGGLGSSWRADPREGLTGVLLMQRTFDSPTQPKATQDFWTMAYGLF